MTRQERTIPPHVMNAVAYNLFEIDLDDCTQEKKDKCFDIIPKLSSQEIFESYLNYEGIIGYDKNIMRLLEKLYNINFKELEPK